MSAFYAGHQADYDSLNDTGQIYVVNHTRNLPKGFELKYKSQKQHRKDTKREPTQTQGGDNTDSYLPASLTECLSKAAKSTHHSAPPLLKLCIRFVAINIDLVDSLIDFPEVVGKSLFQAVVNTGILDEPSLATARILCLFNEAYHEAVLDKLSFAGLHQLILPHLDLWTSFRHLAKLDVTGCKLGDDHEFLHAIGQMRWLCHLNLTDNALTDRGIQKLTSPLRVLHTGPADLQQLSLACNPRLGDGCIRYLHCWPQLSILDLSGTSVTHLGIQKLETKSQMYQRKEDTGEFSSCFNCGDCRGWAGQVVNKWLQNVTQQPSVAEKLAEQMQSKSKIGRFYGRSRIKAELASKVSTCSTRPPATPRIHMTSTTQRSTENRSQNFSSFPMGNSTNTTSAQRKRRRRPTMEEVVDQVTEQVPSKVCKLDTDSETSSSVVAATRRSCQRVTLEEEDMMGSYQTGPVRRADKTPAGSSLWDAMNSHDW